MGSKENGTKISSFRNSTQAALELGRGDQLHAFFGEKLQLVREARGLSQVELSRQSGLSQGFISKAEANLNSPDEEQARLLADALDVYPSFFSRTDFIPGVGPNEVFHRKRNLGKKKLAAIHAQMSILLMVVYDMLESIEYPVIYVPEVDGEDEPDVEALAEALRTHWYVPEGPVASVTQLLNRAGILLVPFDFSGEPVDAVGRWLMNEVPVIFYNPSAPDDRLRFTLMHEVGHFCLHRSPTLSPLSKRIEEEADQFASAFLMPRDEIRAVLRGLSITKLGSLKLKWKCSMGSLIQRAKHLGTISPRTADELWRQMSTFGYRTREPEQYDVHCEEPGRRFSQLVNLHLEELGYTVPELGARSGLQEGWKHLILGLSRSPKLRVVG